jgi:hypothetical protein
MKDKFILDACCSGRMMWYNKKHPNTIYMDIRKEEKGFIKGVPNFEVNPDVIGDFRNLPEEIKQRKFKLIAWDIPHFKAKALTGAFLKKFGGLNPETWDTDIENGFKELWEVLEDYGVLILKFSNYHIKFEDILRHFPVEPLFYNKTSGTDNKTETRWFCFMKIPEGKSEGKT